MKKITFEINSAWDFSRPSRAKRNQTRTKNINEANKIQKQLLNTLLKHTAVNKVLSEQVKSNISVKPKKGHDSVNDEDIFKLPPSQLDSTVSSSEEEEEEYSSESSPTRHWDLHTIDEKSKEFLSLPADVRHEILTDLKETRKQNSWGRIHELPTQSDDFATYQMKRLLKRYSVQTSLEEAEKEMGGRSLSLGELESLLNDHGVITQQETTGNRIASDENVRYLYIKDVKKAMEKAKVETLQPIDEDDDNLKCAIIESLKCADTNNKTTEILTNDKNVSSDAESAHSLSVDPNNKTTESLKNDNSSDAESAHSLSVDTNNKSTELQRNDKNFSSHAESAHSSSVDTNYKTTESLKDDKNVGTDAESAHSLINIGSTDEDHDLDYQEDLNFAIHLSLQDTPSTSSHVEFENAKINSKTSTLSHVEFEDAKISSKNVENLPSKTMKIFSAAKSYMMEYSGLTPSGIEEIMAGSTATKSNNENSVKINIDEFINAPLDETPQTDSNDLSPTNMVIKNKILEEKVSTNKVLTDQTSKITPLDNATSEFISDSDTSDDFVEVSEADQLKEKGGQEKSLEIVIDPDNELDDDIFSDIFSADKMPSIESRHGDNSLPIIIGAKQDTTVPQDVANLIEKTDGTPHVNLKNLTQNNKSTDEVITIDDQQSTDLNNLGGTAAIDDDKHFEETSIDSGNSNLVELLGATKTSEKALTNEDLKLLGTNLEKDAVNLISERSNKERMASNITDQMYQEAQELLQLFGVPYIVAPMEAEAQCAFLNISDLTEGTITDDSDIWLFGGKTVYKNFFNQNKCVMEYRLDNIEHNFNLTRHNLIQLSLLVGSDYTVGLQGVGPVTALEILAAFPSKFDQLSLSHHQLISGLSDFRLWLNKGRIVGPGKATLRNKLKNLQVTENFPSVNVVRAYLEPEVEKSKEKFSWSKPDIVALVDYGRAKFGWTQKKSEEILKPVIKRMGETKVQSTIRDYFKTKHKIVTVDLSDRMSKRVKRAVKGIGKEHDGDESVEEDKPRPARKPRAKKPKNGVGSKKGVLSKKGVSAVADNNVGADKKSGSSDEEINHLKRIESLSQQKVKEIEESAKKELERKRCRPNLHKKEVIPQRERHKDELMRNKMKAIEIFRKSKQGPGYLKKRAKTFSKPKDDAELSESSSD